MRIIFKFTITLFFISFFGGGFFNCAQAAELKLSSSESSLEIGQEFKVDLLLDTQNESINALEGKIIFLADNVQLKKIQSGNSVVNFWMEKPHLNNTNEIVFSGITPGGVNSKNSLIFSLLFKVVKAGPLSLEINDARALLNDGQGTAGSLSILPLTIDVASDSAPELIVIDVADNLAPESFNLEIAQDKHIFDNRHFIVFATQDKGSGVASYQVRESRYRMLAFLQTWHNAESPYLLHDQELKSYVFVKAVDASGNEKIEITKPQVKLIWQENYIIYAIIILFLFLLFCLLWINFKNRKKSRS